MFSTTVKSKLLLSWEVFCALRFTRRGDKQVLCKISVWGNQVCTCLPISGRATPSEEADTPIGPLFDVAGGERLDRAEVRDCFARLMTSQEPACLKFPGSDEGVAVLLLDAVLEAKAAQLQREALMCHFSDHSTKLKEAFGFASPGKSKCLVDLKIILEQLPRYWHQQRDFLPKIWERDLTSQKSYKQFGS